MTMKTFHIQLPIKEDEIEKLSAGDIVYLTGRIFTLRDRAHQRIDEYFQKRIKLPFDLKNGAILHCGPIIQYKGEKEWAQIISQCK